MSRSANARAAAIVLSAGIAALLAGCSDIYFDRRESLSFQSGDAVASNIAVHTVDPWPRAAADRNLASDGERMQRAAERYRTNKVTPLANNSTSSVQYAPILAPVSGPAGAPSQ